MILQKNSYKGIVFFRQHQNVFFSNVIVWICHPSKSFKILHSLRLNCLDLPKKKAKKYSPYTL